MTWLWCILIALVFGAAGAFGGYTYRKQATETKIGRTEDYAKHLYDDAVRKADEYKKEKILEEALKLFAQSGYMGTSMNDIASKLGVTKAAMYKHYESKQEILNSIIEKMNELDRERVKQYEMPEGDLKKVAAEYKETAFDKIKQFTKVQFLHWTEEEFSSCFRKMLTLEQYREPQMAQLYQNYLASGPLTYMEALFAGILEDEVKARQAALDFYGPIFLLYSIYDGANDKSRVIKLLEEHMDHFQQEMQTS